MIHKPRFAFKLGGRSRGWGGMLGFRLEAGWAEQTEGWPPEEADPHPEPPFATTVGKPGACPSQRGRSGFPGHLPCKMRLPFSSSLRT